MTNMNNMLFASKQEKKPPACYIKTNSQGDSEGREIQIRPKQWILNITSECEKVNYLPIYSPL